MARILANLPYFGQVGSFEILLFGNKSLGGSEIKILNNLQMMIQKSSCSFKAPQVEEDVSI